MTIIMNKLRYLKRVARSLSQNKPYLWIVDRKLRDAEATYTVKFVDTGTELRKKMRRALIDSISDIDGIHAYQTHYVLEGGHALHLREGQTDFPDLTRHILSADGSTASYEDMLKAWGYVIQLGAQEPRLFAFKKIEENWSIKKDTYFWAVFSGNTLIEYKGPVFNIYSTVDFVAYGGDIFILDKNKFDTGMNYRERLKRNKDRVLKEFEKLELFDNVDLMSKVVAVNLNRLRKLETIKYNGYYTDEKFREQLKESVALNDWGVSIQGGKIVVTPENVDDILRLMNNDRVRSMVNEEVFDALVKEKVKTRAKVRPKAKAIQSAKPISVAAYATASESL